MAASLLMSHFTATQIVVLSTVVILFALIRKHASRKVESREPPVIPSTVPYIGHILGMLFYGSRYTKGIGLYIVTDPSLAANVQRATKTLSFNPIILPVLQKVPGFDKRTADMIKSDMKHGYVQQVQEIVHTRLAQGEYLDQLTLRACSEFAIRLQHVGKDAGTAVAAHDVDLLKWVKNLVTVSTAAFFYGPNNPIEQNRQLIDQFWDFDAGIPGLLVGVLPWLTARKAYKGREAVVAALAKYLASPEYNEAADLTKERTEVARRLKVDEENTARSDLTFFFAGITNTSITSFWMILHVFANSELLRKIRKEVEDLIEYPKDPSQQAELSVKRIVKECNLLGAVFKETLRLYSDGFATRVVLSDTLLADTYFLRAGSIVQISGGVIHADSRIWGPDVTSFRPERFLVTSSITTSTSTSVLQSEKTETPNPKQHTIHPSAFRAFGGGATLCPGRHFALNEIVGLVALTVLMLDIDSGVDGIQIPRKKDNVIPIHILEPVKKVQVRMRRRSEVGDLKLKI